MLAGFGGIALVYVASFCSTWKQIGVNFVLPFLRMQPGGASDALLLVLDSYLALPCVKSFGDRK